MLLKILGGNESDVERHLLFMSKGFEDAVF